MLFETKSMINRPRLVAAGLLAVVLFLATPLVWADEDSPEPDASGAGTPIVVSGPISIVSLSDASANRNRIPLVLNATGNGFDFDLGGSETRKLHLYLNSPLTPEAINMGVGTQALSYPGRNILGFDATLEVPLSPALSLTGDIQRSQNESRFQPVGSIQCSDGVLGPNSYTASGCRFIDDSLTGLAQSGLSLGARFDTASTSTAISWFTSQSELSDSGTNRVNAISPFGATGADLLTPANTNPLLPAHPLRQPLGYYDAQASGIDLNFQLGVSTDSHGDVQFGLALTRVLDAEFGGLQSNLAPWGWTISDSFNTAQMNVEWNRGSFSGGIQGFYRDQVDFLNRQSLDHLSTFDVHFTWRTPWNADLSVGASNILNAGADDSSPSDNQSSDPFESIYGRIPYVRYKQDL